MKISKRLFVLLSLALSPLAAQAADSQLVLSCTETQTFLDAPGYTYRIAFSKDMNQAFVIEQFMNMEQGSDWVVTSPLFRVETRGDLVAFSEVTKQIDWNQTESCFDLQRSINFSLQKSKDGGYEGNVTRGGVISVDPSVEDCIFPRPIPPRPSNLVCKLY